MRTSVKLPLLEIRITMIFLSLYWTFSTEPFFIPSLSNLLCNSSTVSLGHIRNYELCEWNLKFMLLEKLFVRIWNIKPDCKLLTIKIAFGGVLCY